MRTSQAVVRIAARWLLVLMLAVVAAIVSVALVNNSLASPQQPVREYLQALRDGEGGRALGILRASVPQSNAAMLDGSALQTSAARISNAEIGDAEPRGGNQVMVPVDYTIDGRQQRSEFLLERSGTQWLVFSNWAFVPAPLPTVEVTVVNSSEATVNGVPVNMPGGRNKFAVFYPGEYEASLNGDYFSAPATRAIVSGTDSPVPPLILLTQATDELNHTVALKVKEFLDTCAAEAVKEQRLQPGCPFYHSTGNLVKDGTINWTITEYPAVSVEAFDGQWTIAPLAGKARVTARQQDNFSGGFSDLDVVVDFSFNARLDVGADTITVTPQLSY